MNCQHFVKFGRYQTFTWVKMFGLHAESLLNRHKALNFILVMLSEGFLLQHQWAKIPAWETQQLVCDWITYSDLTQEAPGIQELHDRQLATRQYEQIQREIPEDVREWRKENIEWVYGNEVNSDRDKCSETVWEFVPL